MTNKDAIKILPLMKGAGSEWDTAIDIAMEALRNSQIQINNQINLCDSCKYLYPACPSKEDDVIFGNSIGNDNICACNKYDPLKTKEDE